MTFLKVTTPQASIAVYRSGAGNPALLFVHADSARASQWDGIVNAFKDTNLVVAFDGRGSGNSSPAQTGDYSYAGRSEDIAAVVEALGLSKFVIVAHSGGVPGAMVYASTHSDVVAGLFLVDPPMDSRHMPSAVKQKLLGDLAGPDSLKAQKDFYASIAGDNKQTLEQVLKDTEATIPPARLASGEALLTWNPETAFDAWQGPTFVLSSAGFDQGPTIYKVRPTIPHLVVKDAGHWIQLDQPDVVERQLRDFLAKL